MGGVALGRICRFRANYRIFKAWLRGYRFSSVGVSGERNVCNPTLVEVVSRGT